MSAYNVLSTIRHDGTIYEAGQVLHEISDEAAKILIEAKAIEPQVREQVKEDTAQAKKDEQTVAAQVKAAGNPPAAPNPDPANPPAPTDQAKTSLLDKAKGALGGNKAPAANSETAAPANPPAPADPAASATPPAPTAEQIAADPQLQ